MGIITYGGTSLNAKRLVEKLIERGDSLSMFFKRGRIVDELGQEDIRELVEEETTGLFTGSGCLKLRY